MPVAIRPARPSDVAALIALREAWGAEDGHASAGFADLFERWVHRSTATHMAFVAVDGDEVVGMAWLGRLERPPTPGAGVRLNGDLQSVYVVPARRDAGVGTALVRGVLDEARRLGMSRVTVQSGARAVPVYERLGFAATPKLLRIDL